MNTKGTKGTKGFGIWFLSTKGHEETRRVYGVSGFSGGEMNPSTSSGQAKVTKLNGVKSRWSRENGRILDLGVNTKNIRTKDAAIGFFRVSDFRVSYSLKPKYLMPERPSGASAYSLST